MEVWPAIDLRGGKCVRLQQGDYDRETVFGEDPAAMACHWLAQGARHLHLVDLDGARHGRPENLDSVRAILKAVTIPCQLGGGIRDEPTISQLLELGLARVVVGTAALKQPDWVRAMCRQFPGRIALGIDARGGRVATDGWLNVSDVPAVELARSFEREPLGAIIYTDIAVDGMLQGPNLAAIDEMVHAVDTPVLASGGITTSDDVARLADLDVAGCIIGRALYEGTLLLANALGRAGEQQAAKGSRHGST